MADQAATAVDRYLTSGDVGKLCEFAVFFGKEFAAAAVVGGGL
jgi:hypothetical protein